LWPLHLHSGPTRRSSDLDVLGVLDQLPRHLHPEALGLELALRRLARLRTARLARRRLGAAPVDPRRRQQLADVAAAADRALHQPLLDLPVEILATAEPALEDVVLVTTEIEDFHRRGSTPHGHAFMIPHAVHILLCFRNVPPAARRRRDAASPARPPLAPGPTQEATQNRPDR